jgi:N-acetylmuramoyl-L-alanine amidase
MAAGVGIAMLLAGCGGATTRPSSSRQLSADTSVFRSASTTATARATGTFSHPGPPRSHHRSRRVALPLAGLTVGIDPGHNGRNFTDPTYINRPIWNGREMETCNTTGTETDEGYTEAEFNFNVAIYLDADLKSQGARVVMTRHSNSGVGPCVNKRAAIIDRSHAAVAIDIHADGGPSDGRGVTVLEPVADGPNDRIIAASRRFGHDVLQQVESLTGLPPSTYDGTYGVSFRDDLAGLNLTTVPEVLIESGNMRNAPDARLLVSPDFQRLEARALDRAIRQFLTGET